MPVISVAMSTYQREDLLPLAVDSVLRQRDVDLELVVVDNASTDGTAAYLAGLSDPRVRVITNGTNLGGIGGRNTALAAVRGRWVAIHDDDDLWAPDKLSRQLHAAEHADRGWSYAGCVYIDGDGAVLGGVPPAPPDDVAAELPVRYAIRGGISNVLWRRDLLDADGLLDDRLTMTADWDVALRLLRTGPPAVAAAPLLAFRQHGSNLSRRAGEFQHELDIIEEKHADLLDGRRVDRGEQWRYVAAESLRSGHRRAAAQAYLRGLRGGDLGCLKRAPAVLAPTSLHPWLRRRLLSDPAWLAQARPWVEAAATA